MYTQWNLFDEMNSYENVWFFGKKYFVSIQLFLFDISGGNTSNFTAINQLFLK